VANKRKLAKKKNSSPARIDLEARISSDDSGEDRASSEDAADDRADSDRDDDDRAGS
jgi:hypothetical protein